MSKLSSNEKDLKTKINYIVVDDKMYHYSLCKKEQENFTLMSNWRLLIYNQDDATLYYTNEPDKIPFVVESVLLKPKKQAVYVNTSIVKNEPKTKLFTVFFNKKMQKDKLVGGQWKFQMQTQELAKQWVLLIKNKKEQKTAKALGISKENASTVNDLFAFGMFGNQKAQQTTPQNKPSAVNPMTQSQRVPEQNKTELNKSAINKSVIVKNETNVLNSININKTQPPQKNNQSSILNEDWNRTSYKKIDPVMPSKSERDESLLFDYAMQNTKKSGVKPTVTEQRRTANPQLNISDNVEYHKYETPQSPSPYLKPHTQRPKISQIKQPQSKLPSQRQQPQSNLQSSNVIKVSPINNQPEIRKSVTNNISEGSKASKNISGVDWNRRFIEEHNEKTIQQFSQFAMQTWLQIDPENLSLRGDSQSKDEENQPQCMQRNKIIYYMAEHGTRAARRLKRQFNNYHYILQSIRENMFINVPLCCIIEYVGIVCLAKAKLPQSAQVIQNLIESNPVSVQVTQQLRTLQLFTKISNQSIKRSATIYDLSKEYGNVDNALRLYIDDLTEYLPYNPESIQTLQFQVRSKLILDNFSRTINPRLEQAKQQIQQHLNIQVSELSDVLSDFKITIASYRDLKQMMHKYGLNTKMLPKLYLLTKSRLVKKFLHTAMFARVIKSDILRTVADFRETKETKNLPRIIQESIRIFCENKSNQQDQVFKNSAQEFKKRYRLAFNMHEIQPGFLISTLMTMISAEYYSSKIDKNKKFFEDANILNKGFLVQLKPKLKTYHNFSTQKTERVMNSCRSKRNQVTQIKNMISLKPEQINLFRDDKDRLYSYLSNYISPFALQHSELKKRIYEKVNAQPPTLSTHHITLNYANFCLEQQKIDEYKKTIETSIDILTYWLGEDHPLQCDIYESLSNYYERKGNSDDGINFMKQALTTCIRSTGTHTEKSGSQYFKLAEKQLKYGEKKEAIDNFYKAKLNMEGLSQQTAEYTILLMRLSNIQLSEGNIDKSIGLAIKAIKSAQNKNISDAIIIKIYEILSRAYELNCSKQEMSDLAHLTAKVFNQSQNDYTYDQMIRISLIGFIMTLVPLKQEKLQEYIGLLQANGQAQTNAKDSLHRLMAYSSDTIIMQKVYKSFNNIEKYVSEIKSGRNLTTQSKEVKWLFQLIIGAVGADFIQGVLNQAKYW